MRKSGDSVLNSGQIIRAPIGNAGDGRCQSPARSQFRSQALWQATCFDVSSTTSLRALTFASIVGTATPGKKRVMLATAAGVFALIFVWASRISAFAATSAGSNSTGHTAFSAPGAVQGSRPGGAGLMTGALPLADGGATIDGRTSTMRTAR